MANDITGLRVGRLTVLHKTDMKANSREYLWKCKCDCGEEVYHKGSHLNCEQPVLSCGCLPKNKARDRARHQVYLNYRNNAKQRGYEFNIDEITFLLVATKRCTYCGSYKTNILKLGTSVFKYTGIDRIDNTKGYTIDNVCSCCKVCNRAKRDMPVDDFVNWLDQIIKFKTQEVVRG